MNTVLLKNNLLAAKAPERGITTHPVVLEVVARAVQRAGGRVIVGDSLTSDMAGGHGYGIATCWYNPRGENPALDFELDHVVSELADVVGSIDGDVSGSLGEIDTRQCPVYMLTGEYDYSCTPEASRDTAAKIDGARLEIMNGLGHFPMSEDPEQFLRYLRPVLEKIRAAGSEEGK